MRLDSVAMILASVALSSGSQIILKSAMTAQDIQHTMKSGNSIELMVMISTSPQVIAGLGCFGLSAVIWLFVLSRIFFGEVIAPLKALGVGLIMGGILLVATAG